jgi:hypothetical protein
VASRRGESSRAAALLDETAAVFRSLGDAGGLAITLVNQAAGAWHRGELEASRGCYREALDLLRKGGDLNNYAQACVGLAFVSVRLGDGEGAGAAVSEARDVLLRMGGRSTNSAGTLLAAAERATLLEEHELAARLFGAADTVLTQVGLRMDRGDVWWSERERCEARLRTALGDAEYERSFAEGQALSNEDALRIAAGPAADLTTS